MTHWLIWLIKHPFSSFIYRTNSLFPMTNKSHITLEPPVHNVTSVSPNCDKYCSKKGKSLLFEKNWQMKWNKKISFIYLSKKRSNFFCHGAIRFAHIGMLSFSPRKDKALFISVTLSSFVFTQRTHKPTKCSLRNKLYSNSILKGVCFLCA